MFPNVNTVVCLKTIPDYLPALLNVCTFESTGCSVFSAPDQGRKRKLDGSSSSQESGKFQPSKKRRPSVVRLQILL